eukprot:6464868-Prymnesium_polylepis.1
MRVDAVRGARRARAEQRPPYGVGAVALEEGPRVDRVAFALGHLLAVGVEHEPDREHGAVGGPAEERGREREHRVEPAAGLIDTLRDEVDDRRRIGLPAERVVRRGERRAARVEPA